MSSWSDYECIRKPRRGLEYVAARAPVMKRVYWRYAPEYYRWRIQRQIQQQVNHIAPVDPLKLSWVLPDEISSFSGRPEPTKNRYKDIGKIKTGDWDKNNKGRCICRSIEETTLFKSIKRKYTTDTQWKETTLWENMSSRLSKNELKNYFGNIDSLANSIKSDGYKTQMEVHKKSREHRVGLLDLLTDEVTIDIGRNGELLFVDGRHRLCLSKVLGIKQIPVFILVRHKLWMEHRELIFQNFKENGNVPMDHPDIQEFN